MTTPCGQYLFTFHLGESALIGRRLARHRLPLAGQIDDVVRSHLENRTYHGFVDPKDAPVFAATRSMLRRGRVATSLLDSTPVPLVLELRPLG